MPVRPLLSIVVPAYNVERYIAEALESVLAQLTSDAEVIVVDDGSIDGTAEVAERFGDPVRVVRAPHAGIAATVNLGMAEAKGSLIGSIDADDRWLPGKLQQSLEVLKSRPEVDGVFGYATQFLSPELESEGSPFEFSSAPMPGPMRGNLTIRREAWDRVGPMEPDLRAGEFVSWYARALDAGLLFHMLPTVLYERRIHGTNTVIRERDAATTDYLKLVKATLDRRRAARRERD